VESVQVRGRREMLGLAPPHHLLNPREDGTGCAPVKHGFDQKLSGCPEDQLCSFHAGRISSLALATEQRQEGVRVEGKRMFAMSASLSMHVQSAVTEM